MTTSYIYKITNIINGSIYIGQTTQKNIEIRFKQHIKESKSDRNDMILLKAIRKYGDKNFICEEIDRVSPHNQEKLDSLEIFYIDKFKATEKPNYNMKTGGTQGSNVRGKFGIEKARLIADDIKNTSKTFSEIATKHNVSSSYVSDINCGEVFPILEPLYPISDRTTKKFFTEETILKIHEDLKNGVSPTVIAKQYNVSNVSISNINNGDSYKMDNVEYPVYKAPNSRKKYDVEDLVEIIKLLKEGLTYYKIEKDYGYSRKTVSNINGGTSYKKQLKELGICDFPIKR